MTDKITKNSINALDGVTSNQGYGKPHGLHWVTTALFLVADMAGGGVVTMPIAMLAAGSIGGTIGVLLIAVSFCYTAHLLGEIWNTMCDRWPMYREHCRKPYPEMAHRSMGKFARNFTSLVLNCMLFGISMVYLSLSAKIMNNIIAGIFDFHIGNCKMIVIIALMLLPITLFKSPADFQWAVVTAMMTTTLSVVLIFVGTALDYKVCAPAKSIPEFNFTSLILSFGTFMFGFGGHGVFPTIQHDMKKPTQFTWSSMLAFTIILFFYLPITYLGYGTYGDSLKDSIINSIQDNVIQQFANFFIAVHCILTLSIILNPLNQEFEHKFKIPHGFGIQRVLYRSGVMLAVVISCLTFPEFEPILNFIGGTTVALTSAIMPCVFNMYLHAIDGYEDGRPQDSNDEDVKFLELTKRVFTTTSPTKLAINIIIIVLAIFCGIITTYNGVVGLFTSSSFSRPCYWPGPVTFDENPLHCCGAYRNVTRLAEFTCPKVNY